MVNFLRGGTRIYAPAQGTAVTGSRIVLESAREGRESREAPTEAGDGGARATTTCRLW
ncbi:hypothetical protein ABID60_001301 [Bradyrhizobium sp. S3.5.5]